MNIGWIDDEIKTGPYAHATWRWRFHSQYKRGGPGACWEWTGKKFPNGYGVMPGPNRSTHLAHRVSWQLANPDTNMPDSAVVRHSCNNPACVNPAHLSIGTPAENVADMLRSGRSVAKVDYFTAQDIRSLYAGGTATQAEIAGAYGISQQTVSLIVRGEKWTIHDLDDYQAAAVMTLQPDADILYVAGKLMIEASEVAQEVFKHVYHDKTLDTDKLLEEMGDTLYYIAALCHLLGWNLGTIAEMNIAKLRDRHGEVYNGNGHYR